MTIPYASNIETVEMARKILQTFSRSVGIPAQEASEWASHEPGDVKR